MSPEKMVRSANQIATFLELQPGVDQIRKSRITSYAIFGILDAPAVHGICEFRGESFDDLVLQASKRL